MDKNIQNPGLQTLKRKHLDMIMLIVSFSLNGRTELQRPL